MLEVGTRVRLTDETAPAEIQGMEGEIVKVDLNDPWGYHVRFDPPEEARVALEMFFPDHILQMTEFEIEAVG